MQEDPFLTSPNLKYSHRISPLTEKTQNIQKLLKI